jgi:glyoxylate/hydroxypyruvate reductase A
VDVRFAVSWKPGHGAFAAWKNLTDILSIGAGVDDLASDAAIDRNIGIVRTVDTSLTKGMEEYALLHVLRHHRLQMDVEANQRLSQWVPIDTPLASDRVVGVMGLGSIGSGVAKRLAAAGFSVRGWRRTPEQLDGVTTFSGQAQLTDFLAGCEILVCLLPLTNETHSILNKTLFDQLPERAHLINAGRGECVVDQDLLEALESGHLYAATLDTFVKEPLPATHPFWAHPRIAITPHTASLTPLASGTRHIATAIIDIAAGKTPVGRVDRSAGY